MSEFEAVVPARRSGGHEAFFDVGEYPPFLTFERIAPTATARGDDLHLVAPVEENVGEFRWRDRPVHLAEGFPVVVGHPTDVDPAVLPWLPAVNPEGVDQHPVDDCADRYLVHL